MPFNWDAEWGEGASRDVVRGGHRMAACLRRFCIAHRWVPASVADFGCGPAITLFDLARTWPTARLHGYDASRVVLEADRARAHALLCPNLEFDIAQLPRAPREKHDLVLCIATLHYLPRPDLALAAMWRTVEPGGYFIFNYPNRATRAWYVRASRTDARIRERFAALLRDESTLSRAQVEAALGRSTIDFWKAVGEPASPWNPCRAAQKAGRFQLRRAATSSSARFSR